MNSRRLDKRFVRHAALPEVADALSVAHGTVRQWVREGMPHERRGGTLRFSVEEVGAWVKSRRASGRPGRRRSEHSLSLGKVRIRKENALARRYEQLADKDAGKLLDADEVRREWVRVAMVIRTRFEHLGASIAPLLYGKTIPEIQAALDDRIAEYLRELDVQPK